MFLLFFILGWMGWGLVHYWMHRLWHIGIRKRVALKFVEPEHMHHILYDEPVSELHYRLRRDRRHHQYASNKYINAPVWFVWVVCFAWMCLISFNWVLLGVFLASLLDDIIHRRSHSSAFGHNVANKRHRLHHRHWTKNYSVFSGWWCDWLFGTLMT